jgi:carbon-monoxide dehydrogenase medium subunit
VIPTTFDYSRATSLDDALAQLKAASGGGKLLAGGHSLIPLMKLRLSEPKMLIDIGRIKELSGIRQKGSQIEIGATTTHHDVSASALLQGACPMVAECAADIGDPQVRNRGTIGGSLAHADPSADYPAVVLALDAGIDVKGPNGARTIKASDFFQDLFTVNLAADEIIVSVRFAPVKTAAYAKLHQRASHYAIVGVAAALDVSGGVVRTARLGLTGAGPFAVRMTAVEQALTGQKATADVIAAASEKAGAELAAINADIHASEEYRRAMIPVFTRRALTAALARS